MSNAQKGLIAAILTLVGAIFGWYVAQTDGDPNTKPDTEKVIDAGKDVYDKYKDLTPAEVTTDAPSAEPEK